MAKYCEYCGTQWDDSAKVCGKCGKPLPDFRKHPPKRNGLWKLLVIGSLCVMAIICLVQGIRAIANPQQLKEPETTCLEQQAKSDFAIDVSLQECFHSGLKVSCIEPEICPLCDEMIPPAGHQWIEAAYSIPQRCLVCGIMQGSAADGTISAGFYYTIALKNNGTTITSNNLADASGFHDIAAVSANSSGGGTYAIGLRKDGTAVIARPAKKPANTDYDYTILDVSEWQDLVAVEAGDRHALGLQEDGRVVSVGSNAYGQCDTSSWTDIIAISAGEKHTVGLKADGTVVAVGSNEHNQCAVTSWKNIVDISAGAEYTAGLRSDGTVVVAGSQNNLHTADWRNIVQISAGAYHLVGLQEDGTVVATGSSGSNRCNVADWSDIVSISAGFLHTSGLRSDGVVVVTGESPDHNGFYWKENDVQLPGTAQSAEVLNVEYAASMEKNVMSAYGFDLIAIQNDGSVLSTNKGLDLSGFDGVVSVAMGDEYALGLRPDGTVALAKSGECYWESFESISNWTDIVAISAGYSHAVGLKADGTVVAAGDNIWGQCDVSDWSDVVAVDVSWDYPITIGVKHDGTLVACGRASTESFAGWSDIVDVEHGRMHTIAVKSDGTVKCEYTYGMEETARWMDIVSVSTSYDTVTGLKADGTVVAAGENRYGQCNVSGWTNIVAVTMSMDCTIGLKEDGAVVYAGAWRDDFSRVMEDVRLPE